MKLRYLMGMFAVCLSAIFLAACGGSDGDDAEAKSDTTTAEAASGEGSKEVKVGLIAAETGPIAFAGKSFLRGAELAVDVLNAEGYLGDGGGITLAKSEGAEDPPRSVAQMRKIASDDDISVVIGGIMSPVAGAIGPVAQSAGLPLVIYGATEIGLNDPPLVLRTATLPQDANRFLGEQIAEQVKPKTAAFVVTGDNAGMAAQVDSFIEPLEAAGVENLGLIEVETAQTDFGGAATRAMENNPDVIVVSCIQDGEMAMIKELRNRGYEGMIVGNETLVSQDVHDAMGKDVVGVPFPVYFYSGTTEPNGAAFNEAYREKYGEDATAHGAQGYTAIQFIAQATREADGDISRESLSEAMNALTDIEDSVYGSATMSDGQLSAYEATTIVAWGEDGVLAEWTP